MKSGPRQVCEVCGFWTIQPKTRAALNQLTQVFVLIMLSHAKNLMVQSWWGSRGEGFLNLFLFVLSDSTLQI